MKFIFTGILYFMSFLVVSSQYEMVPGKINPFKPGESLVYSIRYGPIHGGKATVKLKLVKYEGNTVYNAKVLARTVGLADKLFKVREHYESFFDPKSIKPVKAIRNVREGNYTRYNEVYFNLEDSTLYSLLSDSVIKVPPQILDMVTALYFVRALDYKNLNPGDSLKIITFFDNEIFPFPLRYKGKELLKTKLGNFQCLRFDPVVGTSRIFESEDDMTIWISDDKNLIPLRVRFDLIVGSIKCDLSGYSGLKYEFKPIED
jgi:hypothetical protein